MSKARTVALGALMVVGLAGVSAAQSTATPATHPDSSSYHRGARRDHKEYAAGRDLDLTKAQKAQIKAIRAKYQPQYKALHNQAKPFLDAARAARQKGDTAGFRSNMQQARQVMQGGKSIRTQERAEVRAILTPAQQAKFDAREKKVAERGERGEHRGWRHKRGEERAEAKK